MAKKDEKTVRLSHLNGGTVVVPADRADLLVAGGNFKQVKSAKAASSEK